MKEQTLNAFDKFLAALVQWSARVDLGKAERWSSDELAVAARELRDALQEEVL